MCLTQPVNMLKTHKSVKENSFKEVQTDLEGPPLTIPISIEFKILEMTLKFFEKILFSVTFPYFKKMVSLTMTCLRSISGLKEGKC